MDERRRWRFTINEPGDHASAVRPRYGQLTDISGQPSVQRAWARRGIQSASALGLVALTSFSQSWALSVSELNVTSALGEPLRASAFVTLTADESLQARCLRLVAPSDSGMPNLSGVSLALEKAPSGATLRFSGAKPMREPMSEMILNIECPQAPLLTRSFLIFLDPPAAVSEVANHTVNHEPDERTLGLTARDSAPRRAVMASTTIKPGGVYTVQPGDALSTVAARVAGRPNYSVWPIARRIFDTNPDAFDGTDPNLLRVGARIRIPATTGLLATGRGAIERRRVPATETQRQTGIRTAPPPADLVEPPSPAPGRSPSRREIVREVPVIEPVRARPAMLLSPRLSAMSKKRLRQRATKPIAARPEADVETPQPQPATAQALPIAAPAIGQSPAPLMARHQPGRWQINWLWLVGGLLVGIVVTALTMRVRLEQRKRGQQQEAERAHQYEQKLAASRALREQRTQQERDSTDDLLPSDLTQFPGGTTAPALHAQPSITSVETPELFAPPGHDDKDNEGNAALPGLLVDEIEAREELGFDEPDEMDLALLAQDYAQNSGDTEDTQTTVELLAYDQEPTTSDTSEVTLGLDMHEVFDDFDTLSLEEEAKQDEDEATILSFHTWRDKSGGGAAG